MQRKKVILASTAIIVGLFSSDMIGQANRPLISEAVGKYKPTPCEVASGGTLWGWFPCPIIDPKRLADEVQTTMDENLKLEALMEQLQEWQKTLSSVTAPISQVKAFLNSLFSFGGSAGPLTTFKDDGRINLPQVMASANPANVPDMSRAVADFYLRPGATNPAERTQLSRSVYSDGLGAAVAAKSVVTKNQDEIKKLSEEVGKAKTLRDDFVVNAKIRLTLLQALEERNRLVARLTSGQAVSHLRQMGQDSFASNNSWASNSNAYGNPQAYANSVEQEARSEEALNSKALLQAQDALNAGRQSLVYAVELHNGLITGHNLNQSIQSGGGSDTNYLREELQTLSQRYGASLDTPEQVHDFINKLAAETQKGIRTATQIMQQHPSLGSDASLRRMITDQQTVLENLRNDSSYRSYISVNANVPPSSTVTD
ncbi:hypothetical protein [Microvirga sp. VF16]|uniref:hypothetical protein n=1 Tax=Microvirga sp. VF16 TaxID=2807101 RepID=UPI00193D901A|nr:hypothetical protein [Microvirga sp. VF16]QRM34966.1 hypothetical protein JO965_42665 [Microvirga sp. VF16]